MADVLSATHLVRRFALFALTLLFLLTMLRAGHALWHFTALPQPPSLPDLFIQGLRVDLSLVGTLLLPIVVSAPLLGLLDGGRGVARLLVIALLTASLVGVLVAEYITPAVWLAEGVRPGVRVLEDVGGAAGSVLAGLRAAPVPALLGAVLIALVTIAFLSRLETRRLLARRLSGGSALTLSLLGGLACLIALWSGIPGLTDPLTMEATRIGDVPLANELVLNTAWKLLYPPVIDPLLAVLSNVPGR